MWQYKYSMWIKTHFFYIQSLISSTKLIPCHIIHIKIYNELKWQVLVWNSTSANRAVQKASSANWFVLCSNELAHHQNKSSLVKSLRCLWSEWTGPFRMGLVVNSTVHGPELQGAFSNSRMVTLLGAAVLRMLKGTKSVTWGPRVGQ